MLEADDVGEEAAEAEPAGITPEQLTDATTECAFGCPALAIWARQSPGRACTFGPLPRRWDGLEVTVGAAVCGAAEVDAGLSDDEAVGLTLACGAPPPIETAAAAVAVPAPTMRTTAIATALAGRAFENILLLLRLQMVSRSELERTARFTSADVDDTYDSVARKNRTELGRHGLLYPHFGRTFPQNALLGLLNPADSNDPQLTRR